MQLKLVECCGYLIILLASYFLFHFLCFSCFGCYFLQWVVSVFYYCTKSNNQSLVQLKKFYLDPYLSLRWSNDFELFVLYWKWCSYISLSVVILGSSEVFFVFFYSSARISSLLKKFLSNFRSSWSSLVEECFLLIH